MKTDGKSRGLIPQSVLELYISHACCSGLLFPHLQNEQDEQRLIKHGHARPGRGQPKGQGSEAYDRLSHGQASKELDVG